MPDENDDPGLTARLLDEIDQLKEELAGLRRDYEHVLYLLNRTLREEMMQ